MPPDPEVLHSYMTRHFPGGVYHSVYEAGFSGFWAHRDLIRLGFSNQVVHPADVPTSDKERRQKEDIRDSRKLARSLENRETKALHIPLPAMEELRSLCRLRERSSSHLRRLKNRIKGFLKYYGIRVPEDSAYLNWSGPFRSRLEALCTEPGPRSDYLSLTLEALREESKRQAIIIRRLRSHCRQGEPARIIGLLRSIHGIGPKAAFILYTELQDINRFKNLDKLNSYIGLIPSTNSTGDDPMPTGITPRSNRSLRTLLIEASWVAIRVDQGLLRDFSNLARRMKKQAAIVRIARKLAARVAHVWRTGTPYQPVVPIE